MLEEDEEYLRRLNALWDKISEVLHNEPIGVVRYALITTLIESLKVGATSEEQVTYNTAVVGRVLINYHKVFGGGLLIPEGLAARH